MKTGRTRRPLSLDDADLSLRLEDENHYRQLLARWQSIMSELAIAVYHHRRQVVIVFEGWDAAGKGGAIRRLTEKLDPRSHRVHPIGKPSDTEAMQHYLQRFWQRLPDKGQIAIFDRSWYGRVLVERVEGLASPEQWKRGYSEINAFEKILTDSGMTVIKLFLHISQKEQHKRFLERLDNPRKNWKLTPDDLRNREKHDQYWQAIEAMFRHTHTQSAPWHLIAGEHKWYARTRVLETVCQQIKATGPSDIPRLSPVEIAEAKRLLGLND